jgi:hypothetical protein
VTKSGGVLSTGLVGHWTFDGKNMLQNVTDSSGQGNNGRLLNFTSTSSAQVIGKIGQALNFDGTDDTIIVPDSPTTNLSTNITMSAWFYNRQWKEADIIEKGGAGGYMIWTAPSRANHIVCGKQNGNVGTDAVISQTDFSNRLNEWIHIACVDDGSTQKIYVNGALDISASRTTSYNNSSPLQIGNGDDGKFNGLIDDVRIYNRAISASEVKQLYNSGR